MNGSNPFPANRDRAQIWDMLVTRDIAAFIAGDWARVADDFVAERFTGTRGAAHPGDWHIAYPTIEAYRDDWLRQSAEFARVTLADETPTAFLHRATRLLEIEINGDRAIAHKKFKGRTRHADGGETRLDWRTVYHLAREDGRWRITGFVGYLPHPFPAERSGGAFTTQPEWASQHVTAGPYSPVLRLRAGEIVAISGQGPLDQAGRILGKDVAEQTRVTLDNCVKQLAAGGATLADVFQARVYLASMEDWPAFNAVYREYMTEPYPVRTAIEARLWGGMLVEIDMMANVVA